MKRLYGIFALLLSAFLSFPLYAEDYKSLLRDVDALVSYDTDYSAEYTIVQEKPGETRSTTVCAVFRRDSGEKYVILIVEPSLNKGQGYLKLGKTLWFYDPESRRFNSTGSKEKFQNTNARNSDFTRSTLASDYNVAGAEKTRLGKYDCTVLDLTANNDEVTYPHMKIWINEDNLVLKTEDYSLSRQLLRTTLIPNYRKIGSKYVPARILIIDNLLGKTIEGQFVNEKTQITIDKVSLDPLPDSLFSKQFLESVSQ